MNERKPIDSFALTLMIILCATWGFQQVAIKMTAGEISPILQSSLRSGIAAFCVYLFMLLKKERLSFANWKPGLLIGLLFAIEFLCVSEGLRYTSASHIVVFLYTAPIFVALGLNWKISSERLQLVQWLGMFIAFIGIVMAFWASPENPTTSLRGDIYGLLAGIAWAFVTIIIRTTSLAQASAKEVLLYQLMASFILLFGASFLFNQSHFAPTSFGWLSLIFQGIFVAFITYLIWFWLLRNYLASRLGVLSFMTPIFGIAFGVIFLSEPLEPRFLFSAALVIVGIILVTGYSWVKQVLFSK